MADAVANAGTVTETGSDWTLEALASGAFNGTFASCASIAALNTSARLVGTNCGFSVPAGATIDNIKLKVWGFRNVAATPIAPTQRVQLRLSGGAVGDVKSTLTTFVTAGYSAASFMEWDGDQSYWNTTLDADDINASTFGASIWYSVGIDGPEEQWIDAFEITVSYTVNTGDSTTAFRRGRGRSRMRGLT